MKIADLSVARYADHQPVADLAPGREVVVVTVTSDDGLTGTGFTNAPLTRAGSTGEMIGNLLSRHIKPLIVGDNPVLTDDLWRKVYGNVVSRLGRRGMLMGCLAAVDFAVWTSKPERLACPCLNCLAVIVNAFRPT